MHIVLVESATASFWLWKKTPPVAYGDSPLWDGAFGITVNFPAKAQSFRVRQRLPPRGSWQNRQVLTEGVRSNPSREKVNRENPQIFPIYKLQIIFPLNMARAQAEAISNCLTPPQKQSRYTAQERLRLQKCGLGRATGWKKCHRSAVSTARRAGRRCRRCR